MLATAWVGNLSCPDSRIQTPSQRRRGEGEDAAYAEEQRPHEGSDLWMN